MLVRLLRKPSAMFVISDKVVRCELTDVIDSKLTLNSFLCSVVESFRDQNTNR